MISVVIRDLLATSDLGLTVSENLFAESAAGEQHVLVRTTYDQPEDGMPAMFRRAAIQITVYGYEIYEGKKLSEKILAVLEDYFGETVIDLDKFYIKSISPVMLPTLTVYKDFRAYTMNFTVHYTAEYSF